MGTTNRAGGWAEALTTACFLHYNLDIPTVVRYLGGPHVAALRDTPRILKTVQPLVDPILFNAFARILTLGAPARCVANSSKYNYQLHRRYGNHSMPPEQAALIHKALVKEDKWGYVIIASHHLTHSVYNAHLTPYGVAIKAGKKDRPFSDASFHPADDAMGVNDWTNKDNELPVIFQHSETLFYKELYNLRISFPAEDIFIGDDDIQGACKHVKYNPNVVGMHGFQLDSHFGVATGQTFGGVTSPANFEVIARVRQCRAQHLYYQPTTVALAQPYLPPVLLAPLPTRIEIASFAQATPDTQNMGALDQAGCLLSPGFFHHVDDNIYNATRDTMVKTLSASVLALYTILGFPHPLTPDPLSRDKLHTTYNHLRRILGKQVDSRRLMVTLPDDKRATTVALLAKWIQKSSFGLLEAAQLIGVLDHISTMCRWGRAEYFAILNSFRDLLRQQYHIVARQLKKRKCAQQLKLRLPKHLEGRVQSLISRKIAATLWRTKAQVPIANHITTQLKALHAYLANPTKPWEISIAHLIDRDPTFVTTGDASQLGTGAFNPILSYWLCVDLSSEIRQCLQLKPKDKHYLHINLIEFATLILQLAATIARLEEPLPHPLLDAHFPHGLPPIPHLQLLSDNTTSVSWANKVSSKSIQGQELVRVWAALLKSSNVGIIIDHIAGETNTTADLISRAATDSRLLSLRLPQLLQQEPRLANWDFFLPSPTLLSSLASALSLTCRTAPVILPERLGQFVPTVSTTSNSVLIPELQVGGQLTLQTLAMPILPSL